MQLDFQAAGLKGENLPALPYQFSNQGEVNGTLGAMGFAAAQREAGAVQERRVRAAV